MDLKQFLQRWLARHEKPANRLLHTIGIPATIVGVVLLCLHLWLAGVLCIVAGYVLQVIGHSTEGSKVGELILLKKIYLPQGPLPKRLTITAIHLLLLVIISLVIQGLLNRMVYFNLYETVSPGMYRSGQMPPQRLAEFIHSRGLTTVVNLSQGQHQPTYLAEQEAIAQTGANLVQLPLRASHYPSPKQLTQLLEVVESLEAPFLVHCHGGADRTGLFFVLLALRQGQTWPEAMGQLSFIRFNYCRSLPSATITHPLYDFADYTAQQNWPRDLEHFRLWLRTGPARKAYKNWRSGHKR